MSATADLREDAAAIARERRAAEDARSRLVDLVELADLVVPRGLTPSAYAVIASAALAQLATVVLTWRLWAPRQDPPNLSLIEGFSGIHWGPPLLVLAALTVAWPKRCAVAFAATYALAVLGDQTRLQPEVISLALLMTLPALRALGIARWHLATLWCWAGVNKALSVGWSTGGAMFIASSLGVPSLRLPIAIGVPALEIAVGLAAAFRPLWPVARWAGLGLNLAILVTLSPLFAEWNSAVWPWNLSLAVSAVLLFAPGQPPPTTSVWPRAAAAGLALHPALFYVGHADAYLTHNLYSSNTASAAICRADAVCSSAPFDTWSALNVPLPPESRLYQQWFDSVCAPGEVLVVRGPATRINDPPSVTHHPCP